MPSQFASPETHYSRVERRSPARTWQIPLFHAAHVRLVPPVCLSFLCGSRTQNGTRPATFRPLLAHSPFFPRQIRENEKAYRECNTRCGSLCHQSRSKSCLLSLGSEVGQAHPKVEKRKKATSRRFSPTQKHAGARCVRAA